MLYKKNSKSTPSLPGNCLKEITWVNPSLCILSRKMLSWFKISTFIFKYTKPFKICFKSQICYHNKDSGLVSCENNKMRIRNAGDGKLDVSWNLALLAMKARTSQRSNVLGNATLNKWNQEHQWKDSRKKRRGNSTGKPEAKDKQSEQRHRRDRPGPFSFFFKTLRYFTLTANFVRYQEVSFIGRYFQTMNGLTIRAQVHFF